MPIEDWTCAGVRKGGREGGREGRRGGKRGGGREVGRKYSKVGEMEKRETERNLPLPGILAVALPPPLVH